MAWPLSQEYNEAVQNPRTSFSDPDLRAGEVVTGPLGIPMPRSGNFADVYQVHGADGRVWALKCFTRPAAGLRERYLQIDSHLRDARLPFSVGFQFLLEGVRIRGLWFPALKMEWVEGLQLNQFARENADKPEHLRALLGLWVRLCRRLRDARIAHADLQHGNVLLVPGDTANTLKLRLIDYDGMWVPTLATNASGEAGHPAYQHPARLREKLYSADVDRFPHLVIGCALRALAIAGRPLWNRFDNGDNMLFREADLADPANSPLFKALWELDDPTLTNLVALLVVCASRPSADTPWLDELLEGEKPVPVSDAVLAHAAKVLGVTRRAARKPLPVANLYVVPEEANTFIEMGAWPRRRRSGLAFPIIAACGIALAAVIVLAIVLLNWGGKGTTPVDPGTSPGATSVVDKVAPPLIAKLGVIETKWSPIAPGPAIVPSRGLVSGIDVSPPNSKIVRTYPLGGTTLLAAWPLADGAHAVVVSKSGIGVLDLDSAQVQPFPVPRGDFVHAAIGPNRKYVLTAGKDHTVRCFDIALGRPRWSQKFKGPIGALACTPDGLRVAATAEKVGYIEWNIANGNELRRHESLQAAHLGFTSDGHFAVAAGESGVELWSLDDAKITSLSTTITASALAVSADGKLAYASTGSEVKGWSLPDGKPLPDRPLAVKHPISTLATSSDGTLLVGTQNAEVALLGTDDTAANFSLAPDIGSLLSFGLTGDGNYALASSEKGSIAVCRVADLVNSLGASKSGPSAGCLEFARTLRLAPEFKLFAVDALGDKFLAASDTQVGIYNAVKFSAEDGFRLQGGKIVAAGFGPEGKIVVCQAEEDKFVTHAFDPKKKMLDPGPNFLLPKDEPGRITRIVPIKDHPWVIATTEFSGDVLFDPATGLVVEGWPKPDAKKPLVATPSPDGASIAIGSVRDPIQLWDCGTTSIVRPFEASSGVTALAFTPDGKQLVGLWPRGRVRTWAPESGKLNREVDHPYTGPFAELAAVTDDAVVLGTAPNRNLLSLVTGRGLSTGDGPDPLQGRGPVIPSRALVLARDREGRITAWRVEPRQGLNLPTKPPEPNSWPDVRVVRDAPVDPPVGMAFSADEKSVILASPAALTRYSADRLILVNEVVADEGPLRMMTGTRDQLFALGKKHIITLRDARTLAYQDEIATGISARSTPTLFVVHPHGTYVIVYSDKLHVFDVKLKKETFSIATIPKAVAGRRLTQFAYSADGEVGVARWGNSVTAIWHPKLIGPAKVLQELKTSLPATEQSLVLSDDGKFAILGTGDGKLTIWDTATGKVAHEEEAYPPVPTGDAIAALALIPGTNHFVTAGRAGKVIVWNLQGFTKVKEYLGPDGPWRIAIAPDGKTVFMQQPGMMQSIDLPRLPRS